MKTHDVSIPNAKDAITVDLGELSLAMPADSTFMSEDEYDTRLAELRHAKRWRILNPPPPLRPTMFGMFIIGLITGALIAMLITFAMSVTGVANGIALVLGIALILGVIGVNMGADK